MTQTANLLALLSCLIVLCGGALYAGEPASVDPQTVHRNAQELWRANIAAPQGSAPTTDLGQAANEVQALTAAPQSPKPAAPAPRVPPVPKGAPTAAPATDEPNVPAAATQPLPPGPPPLEANTLERLKLAPPTGPAGKVALADSLFAQDQLDAAAVLYTEALAQDQAGRDKDWLLFQIGNCLRAKDVAAAKSFYKRVSAECPSSSWAVIAATECQYLERQQEPTTKPASAKSPSGAGVAGARSTPLAAGRAIAAAPKVDANAR